MSKKPGAVQRQACPILVTGGDLPNWTGGTIKLQHEIEPWLIRYEGGRTATATSTDGVRLLLCARRKRGHKYDHTMLAVVRTADRCSHLIHAAARTVTATSRYETTGFGRFQRHHRVGKYAGTHPQNYPQDSAGRLRAFCGILLRGGYSYLHV